MDLRLSIVVSAEKILLSQAAVFRYNPRLVEQARSFLFSAVVIALFFAVPKRGVAGQPHSLTENVPDQPEMSNGALARATSDPTSDLWYLFLESAVSFRPDHPFSETNQFTFEFQPSMPVPLTRSWHLLNYPDLVFATEGTRRGSQATGLQSFSWLSALSPVSGELGFSWAVGPYLSFPVSTDEEVAESQWQAGAGGVVAWRTRNFLASAIIKNGWTVAGPGDEAGSLQIQYNLQYFFGDGLQVGLGRPRIEYTWHRDGSGGWDVPVGVDVARIFHLGPLPVKIMLEYDFFVINDSRWEPEHLFRLTLLPVLPGPFKEPIFGD